MFAVKRLAASFASLLLIFAITVNYLPSHFHVKAAVANHVVISEVQVQSNTSVDDEFVELYNPTNNPVDITGWRLTKRTAFSGEDDILVSSITGIIPAHGYFLIAHSKYDDTPVANQLYSNSSNSIANNNSVHLYSDAGVTVVDRVGMGSSINGEGESVATPVTGQSVERKAQANSDYSTMGLGGAHQFLGNGEDTQSNINDFFVRLFPLPQSTTSPAEIPPSGDVPTPTQTISVTPTNTPTATPSPTLTTAPTPTTTVVPTSTPTVTPTTSIAPTSSPTPTPTLTNTPTPTVTTSVAPTPTLTPTTTVSPSVSPSISPSVTPTPTTPLSPTPSTSVSPSPSITNTPTPTLTPNPTPTPGDDVIIQTPFITCQRRTLRIRTLFGTLEVPIIQCMIR